MHITSTAFEHNEQIPKEYGYDGKNVNPPLTFSEVPPEAKSLVLVIEDPDAPNGVFAHWIVYDMSPAMLQILEGKVPMAAQQATNDFGQQAYGGPKPPAGTHRYFFKLFALDTTLDGLRPTDKRPAVYAAMSGHVLAQAELIGLFSA